MPTTENMEITPIKSEEPAASESGLGISYFVVSGAGDRNHNEDAYGHAANADTLTFVVSDGVGGQAGGSAAAHLVVEMVREQAHSFDRDEMLGCYAAIDQEMRRRQQQFLDYKKMGATVAELRLDTVRQMALWGHFGDSRVYWFRGNEIMAVTDDHSVVHSLVTAGLISRQEALTHSKKNILLGAFGVAADISPQVAEKPVYLAEGDAFLLCTDGLWSHVPDDEITKILSQSSSVEGWVKGLEARVKQASIDNKDNYTILGVRITSSYDRTVRLTSRNSQGS